VSNSDSGGPGGFQITIWEKPLDQRRCIQIGVGDGSPFFATRHFQRI